MDGIEFENFWTTSTKVEAFQLTKENIREASDNLEGVLSYVDTGMNSSFFTYKKDKDLFDQACIGEWVVRYSDNRWSVFTDDEFKKFFLSHDQRLGEDEKYAKVYLQVKSAMNKQDSATYHGNGGSDEMDLVAIETTKALLREI